MMTTGHLALIVGILGGVWAGVQPWYLNYSTDLVKIPECKERYWEFYAKGKTDVMKFILTQPEFTITDKGKAITYQRKGE